MNYFSLGSCRTTHFFSQLLFDYTHNTKQLLDVINIMNNNIEYNENLLLLNRYLSSRRKFNNTINNLKTQFIKADIILLEISSLKILRCKKTLLNYQMDNYYYIENKPKLEKTNNHKYIMKIYNKSEEIIHNTENFIQGKNDFLNDLEKIYKYFIEENNKKIIFIPHLNFSINGEFIQNRVNIIEWLNTFCNNKKNCWVFNSINYLSNNGNDRDINHLTKNEHNIIKEQLTKFINNL